MAYTEAHAVGYLMLAHPLRCPMAASHLSLPLSHVDLDKRGTAKERRLGVLSSILRRCLAHIAAT